MRHERYQDEGTPDYEPQLKAGGHWSAQLTVPEKVRRGVEHSERDEDGERRSFTWIIEVASQVLFSTTASVHYELLVGRDKKSLGSGLTGAVQLSAGYGLPGRVEDVQRGKYGTDTSAVQMKGVFSKAIRLAVDDTESLWNTPAFPSWNNNEDSSGSATVNVEQGPTHGDKRDAEAKKDGEQRKPKKVHLVIITHGLHSNLGADMLYMKESIDTAAKQAREDAKKAKAEHRAKQAQQMNQFGRNAADLRSKSTPDVALGSSDPPVEEDEDDDDEEQVIVRGFNGNAVKTERGIQYLGKRLAKYVLSITYPDQPYHPIKSSISKTITRSLTGQKLSEEADAEPTHKRSSIVKDDNPPEDNSAYKISSISFISHSLGGLVQTYAVAYIQKHSPEFFHRIKPINFVAMASPFLGLSNENPVYVKFALDFGLVGRTGQDLGLTWRAPTIARSGWSAMVNGLVNDPHKDKQPDPGSKPLLRILPTGPAHEALKMFRNRTVYSNVVNDGIVPLRTSCLLFLDWRGLGRVEKARRENGLVGTMVNWGWTEMTGQNVSTKKGKNWNELFNDNDDDDHQHIDGDDPGAAVPHADVSHDLDREETISHHNSRQNSKKPDSLLSGNTLTSQEEEPEQNSSPWMAILSYFRPQAASNTKPQKKAPKMFRRGQTMKGEDDDTSEAENPAVESENDPVRGPVRGSSFYADSDGENVVAPPRTSFFESAGDLLAPPLPPPEFLLDPAARPRTIFHDRVYHPDDIPMPPTKRQRTFMKRTASQEHSVPNQAHEDLNKISSSKSENTELGSMRIEEKIARAYHKDMSWRKVLVRLEPDAHNNMIVRRMFANAYGWPVVKHLCDTHFAYTIAARTRDEDEPAEERARPANERVGNSGEEVRGQKQKPESKMTPRHEEAFPRSATFNPMSNPADPQHEILPTQHEELRTIHSRVAEREQFRGRTASEVRESRDQVPDLVTMVNAQGQPSATYSALHSGGAGGGTSSSHSAASILSRLHRQDSGRWSDRFFDESDEDNEDDDREYYEELRKARDRGVLLSPDQMYLLNNKSGSQVTLPHHGVNDNSGGRAGGSSSMHNETTTQKRHHQSLNSEHRRQQPQQQRTPILSSDPDRNTFVQEPDQLDENTDTDNTSTGNDTDLDPQSGICSRDEPYSGNGHNDPSNNNNTSESRHAANTSRIGLGKSAAEQVAGEVGHGHEGENGTGAVGQSGQRRGSISELVASASRHAKDGNENTNDSSSEKDGK